MDPTEFELKVALGKSALRRFKNSPVLRQLSSGPPKTCKLRSVYFDTADLKFFQAGISLRLRKRGKKYLQTAKSGTKIRNGISNPIQVECLVKSNYPDISKFKSGKFKTNLANIISGAPLKPIFETSIWRTTRKIKVNRIGTVELAIDQGEIQAGTRKKKIQEVELELISGHPCSLLSAAETLFSMEKIKLSEKSKAAQGYEILNGGTSIQLASLTPENGRQPKLHRKMTGQEALVQIGTSACDQILHNYKVVLESNDPEGPHQLRVGLRRLRTALRILKPGKDNAEMNQFKRDTRDLARIVGHLRDADVLLEDIYMPAAKRVLENSDQSLILKALTAHRERLLQKVSKSLTSSTWTAFRLNCIFFDLFVQRLLNQCDSPSRLGRIIPISSRELDKRWRRVNRWGKNINKLSVAQRHEMRKELKSLRYATEYFQQLYPHKESQRFLKQLKRLQDIFGYLNDVALSIKLFDIVKEIYPDNPEVQHNVELICNFHSTEANLAWNDARKRWKKLKDAPKFWH